MKHIEQMCIVNVRTGARRFYHKVGHGAFLRVSALVYRTAETRAMMDGRIECIYCRTDKGRNRHYRTVSYK